MNQYPATHQVNAQQLQANRLLHCQTVLEEPKQLICSIEVSSSTLIPPLDIGQIVQVGGSTAAILLSIGIAIAIPILALAEYNKVFIPVILQRNKNTR